MKRLLVMRGRAGILRGTVYMKLAVTAALLFVIMPAGVLRAEFVFKKDGSIIKGKIVSDEISFIAVNDEEGKTHNVERRDVLRIVYTDLFLGKVFARLTTGEVVEGFQVYENRDEFLFRKELMSPDEIKIPRRKVMFIVRTNPTDVRGAAHPESIDVLWSPPFKPAKYYRVFIRDVKSGESQFRLAGETRDLSLTVKALRKSWTYEVYATAVADTGEESLPSEKVVVSTLPEAPSEPNLAEKLAPDGGTVELSFSWTEVNDPASRVTSYIVYEIEGSERKKKGVSQTGRFVLSNFPAEGRHWFSIVAVNDDFTESDEIRTVYDAGYRIYIRTFGVVVNPLGNMTNLASAGYGGLLDIGLSGRRFSLGLETGCIAYSPEKDVKRMLSIPVMLELDYRLPVFWTFSFRPVLKAGGNYNIIDYIVQDPANPLLSHTQKSGGFDPAGSAGAYLQCDIAEKAYLFGGAEYSMIFQSTGMMSYIGYSFGVGVIF
jgi:hypothetical protein